jgi:hypothetical protein
MHFSLLAFSVFFPNILNIQSFYSIYEGNDVRVCWNMEKFPVSRGKSVKLYGGGAQPPIVEDD